MVKIVCWNCNSICIRLGIVKKLAEEENPDIICLQETKVSDAKFPLIEFKMLGYDYIYTNGQRDGQGGGQYGVATISKFPLLNAHKHDPMDYNHARHICLEIPGKAENIHLHNFYVPAGGDIPSCELNPKFDHKIKFMNWLIQAFYEVKDTQKSIILGDLNIAPLTHDVYDSKKLKNVVSHTQIERDLFAKLLADGELFDPFRATDTESKIFTWWSYRVKQSYERDFGRRLDHILLSKTLENRVKSVKILREYRTLERPSDHVPLIIEIG
jgi:exodeoxyribonuclease-3